MEDMVDQGMAGVFGGKRVLVTGHTGFKGSWLVHWLARSGAEVYGYALDPMPGDVLGGIVLPSIEHDYRGDVRDAGTLRDFVGDARPEFVFHLAAQSLVRRAYREPLETLQTNVQGTANLLEAVRHEAPSAVCVVVTSDKCYENKEWCYAYRETDALGGHDVYSASKAAAEIVTQSWRKSFVIPGQSDGRMATARGGNVIGGGDFAEDRIIPDAARAFARGEALEVRNPKASRPWQHVLDCLSGYLYLAAWLREVDAEHAALHSTFNFGPEVSSERTVRELVKEWIEVWPGEWKDTSDPSSLHEASRLAISIDRARSLLGWTPVWNFRTTVHETALWYRAWASGASHDELLGLMNEQISRYEEARSVTCSQSPS